MQNNVPKNHLAYISANFWFLIKIKSKLETSNLNIIESLAIEENAASKLNEVLGEPAVIIKR